MASQPSNKPKDLPGPSDDVWEGAEQMKFEPVKLPLCPNGDHFLQQNGNAAECQKCGYGTLLPGYLRVLGGKIIDLRNQES